MIYTLDAAQARAYLDPSKVGPGPAPYGYFNWAAMPGFGAALYVLDPTNTYLRKVGAVNQPAGPLLVFVGDYTWSEYQAFVAAVGTVNPSVSTFFQVADLIE